MINQCLNTNTVEKVRQHFRYSTKRKIVGLIKSGKTEATNVQGGKVVPAWDTFVQSQEIYESSINLS